MKYIITKTSDTYGNKGKPHKDATKEIIELKRIISGFETLEEWKRKAPSFFIDNLGEGYTQDGKPFVLFKNEEDVYTIDIHNICEFVDSINEEIIIHPKEFLYVGLEECNEIEIYDDYRE
jgi:hypothetical protein